MTTTQVARRPVYTAEERSVAKTLALSLGVARARDVLEELWADRGGNIPTANTLTNWRDDKAIPVDRDLAASYEAGLVVTVSSSAERVMLAAETALIQALEQKNLDRLPFVVDLLKVWRGATDRLLVAPTAPKEPVGLFPSAPTAASLPAGAGFRATYEVTPAPPAPAPVREVESRVTNE